MLSSISSSRRITDFSRKAKYDENDNLIDHEDIIAGVYEEIQKDPSITDLSLSYNYLTLEQVALLPDVLKDHKNLRHLDLSLNGKPIESSAIIYFKRIIQEHPTLEVLNLNSSVALDEELIALVSGNSPEFNMRLKTMKISIAKNAFTQVGLEVARKYLSSESVEIIVQTNQPASNSALHAVTHDPNPRFTPYERLQRSQVIQDFDSECSSPVNGFSLTRRHSE